MAALFNKLNQLCCLKQCIFIRRHMSYGEGFQKYRKSNFTCMYKNMVFLDDSQDSVLSRSFFEILTDDHKYPSLVNLNFNSIRLHDLPQQLKHWSARFPLLKRLDLSSNALSSFRTPINPIC